MISELETQEHPVQYQPYRRAVVSLKPKRRFRQADLRPEPAIKQEAPLPPEKPKLPMQSVLRPVFSTTAHRERIKRSGHPNPILRRVIAPTEFSRAMPHLPKS